MDAADKGGLTISVVHSILARCLIDPDFLSALQAKPSAALRNYSLSHDDLTAFERLDTDAVGRFAGFITKVQHNHLWEEFPHTRRLMRWFGIEHNVFTAYISSYQKIRRSPGLSRDQKTELFLAFLKDYAEANAKSCPNLREVLLHEWFGWEIRKKLAKATKPPAALSKWDLNGLPRSTFATLVTSVCGVLRVAEFACDPAEFVRRFDEGQMHGQMTGEPRLLAYWGDPLSNTLRVLEVDLLSAMTLKEVDGVQTIAEISRHVSASSEGQWDEADVEEFFLAAFESGILFIAGSA